MPIFFEVPGNDCCLCITFNLSLVWHLHDARATKPDRGFLFPRQKM